MSTPARPYLFNGEVLQSPPFSVQVRNFFNGTYNFLGLYMTTLFSLDAYAAAEQSSFSIMNRRRSTAGSGPRSGGGGSGGGGGGSGGNGGKKLGTVDDIRGPECKTCQ
ncbi:hypothetical protein MMC28_010885 [Mycoblastus sanguinarius]|nr:hypothetical protein [Mycoblastus sanguinarius]